MEDVQGQMQPKPESELADFMHGHLDDCVPFGSCSSRHNTEDEGVQGGQFVRRRRRSDLEGDDLAESSAARRRHSRILSRWAARQAEDMITTIEMRNREAELMALARLHAVSMLDSSFLRESESPTSRSQGNVERYSTQASSILQMWRELEDESMLNRAQERVRERLSQQRILESNRNMPERRDHDSTLGETIRNENEYATLSNRPISQNENREHYRSGRGRSPVLDDVERERVPDIVRRLGISDHSSNISMRPNHPTEEWLGETERERVRIVRELIQMESQQRGSYGGLRDEHNFGRATQVDDPAEEGSPIDPEGEPERFRLNVMRLRERRALIHLLVRIEREQHRELQSLVEYRAVSHFAHRHRIQSLLRGRFSRPIEDDNELIQLRQRHPVSGLREGIRSRLESLVSRQLSQSEVSPNDQAPTNSSFEVQQDNSEQRQSTSQESDNLQNPTLQEHMDISVGFPGNLEGAPNHGSGILEQSRVDEITTHPESASNTFSVERTLQDSAASWPSETSETNSGNERLLRVTRDAWHEDGSSEVGETWSERTSNPPRNRRPNYRFSRFHPPENDDVHFDNMELRELMSRRRVTTLDRNFRMSLDTVIQQYIRRSQNPTNQDQPGNLNVPATQDHDHVNEDPDVDAGGPSPWQQDLHHSNYPRRIAHRSEIEWEMINDVRGDIARLEKGMNHMQGILEACMEMQAELQRSIRQEVSAALNRSTNFFSFNSDGNPETSEEGSKWSSVRNGTCCICCEDQIDTLLYRCGHMCTCSKCATELLKRGGKCPLCRAPIVEVVRAYSIE